jgi:glycogen debranching enzyme
MRTWPGRIPAMQSCILMARWWRGPKALCELQGYVYNAWVRMAEVFDALGKPERRTELRAKAAALFARFNDAFQDAELGFYAYALDGDVAVQGGRVADRRLFDSDVSTAGKPDSKHGENRRSGADTYFIVIVRP